MIRLALKGIGIVAMCIGGILSMVHATMLFLPIALEPFRQIDYLNNAENLALLSGIAVCLMIGFIILQVLMTRTSRESARWGFSLTMCSFMMSVIGNISLTYRNLYLLSLYSFIGGPLLYVVGVFVWSMNLAKDSSRPRWQIMTFRLLGIVNALYLFLLISGVVTPFIAVVAILLQYSTGVLYIILGIIFLRQNNPHPIEEVSPQI